VEKSNTEKSFVKELKKAFIQIFSMMPMVIAIVGLVGLFLTFVSNEMLSSMFSGSIVGDTLVGTLAGAIAVGQAMISYIIGGELLKDGVSLYAVTAFILSWVSLGFVQLPAEFEVMGVKFTIIRNILAFISTILIAVITVTIVRISI
jgi:uncharacterized membrane protein YraQ (UPF0718 family)